MREWLTALTVGILILLALGGLAYTGLDGRLDRLERQLSQRPPGATATTPAAPPPAPQTATPRASEREASVFFIRLHDDQVQMAPVSRPVRADTPAAGALRALLAGPTPGERASGLQTEIPAGTRLEKLTLQDGRAHARFSPELDRNVAGSARVTAIRRQIELTLRQFPEVDEVVIEVDGRIDDVLQP